MNRYQGSHNMKWGGEIRTYYGEAARFEPINLVFNSAMTANSSDSPDVANTGNQWATLHDGRARQQTLGPARAAADAEPDELLDLFPGRLAHERSSHVERSGLRWEYEPGPTDPDNRLSQRTRPHAPIPEMQATPPAMPAQATALMASKGYNYIYNGAWMFADDGQPATSGTRTWTNFMPRVGMNYRLGDDSVLRFGYARYIMPVTNVRDTLGDFVEQYAGFAQTTNTLGLPTACRGRPGQPVPGQLNPVTEPYGQSLGRYTNLGGAANLDQYELRPQINDRFNVSYQKQIWGSFIVDASYFVNLARACPTTRTST